LALKTTQKAVIYMRRIVLLVTTIKVSLSNGNTIDLTFEGSTVRERMATLTGYANAGDGGELTIPETTEIGGITHTVDSIGEFALYGAPIESVVLPSTLRFTTWKSVSALWAPQAARPSPLPIRELSRCPPRHS
jgi:hypothetical protein